jgi:hypothetical protein
VPSVEEEHLGLGRSPADRRAGFVWAIAAPHETNALRTNVDEEEIRERRR